MTQWPKLCELCNTMIESGDDATWWHGYGNCIEITDEMWEQWEKEAKEEAKLMQKLTDEELLYIYKEIAGGRGQHGSFLRSFAEAVCRADPFNFDDLRAPAIAFAHKFNLQKYLPTEKP